MTTTYTDQQLLDAIRAAIYGTADRGVQSMTINGNPISSLNMSELIKAEKHFAAKMAKASSAGRAAVGRFRNPG